MSDKAENLAEAETYIRNFGSAILGARGVTFLAEYDRRGRERDAFRKAAEHWAAEFRAVKASVAPLSEGLERAEAERDEAIGLLREAVRLVNDDTASARVDQWQREADEWLKKTEALVERTSRGGAGAGHGSAAEALEDET